MTADTSEVLHVINGDSAGASFAQAFGSKDQILIHRDVLSCGPTPKTANLVEWRELRGRFWKGLLDGFDDFIVPDTPADLWVSIDRVKTAREVHVWAGTGNTDQLTIAFVVHLMEEACADAANLRLVQFERFPGGERRVIGTGELNPEQWRAHPPPRALTRSEQAQYRDAWAALTSSDALAIESFLATHGDAPQHLLAALRLVLLRYPVRASGLNDGDLRLLACVRRFAPRVTRAIGHTMMEKCEHGDLEGDSYLFARVLRMAQPQAAGSAARTVG